MCNLRELVDLRCQMEHWRGREGVAERLQEDRGKRSRSRPPQEAPLSLLFLLPRSQAYVRRSPSRATATELRAQVPSTRGDYTVADVEAMVISLVSRLAWRVASWQPHALHGSLYPSACMAVGPLAPVPSIPRFIMMSLLSLWLMHLLLLLILLLW